MKFRIMFFATFVVTTACSPSMQDIQQQVANDSIKAYELSVKAGDKIEICVKTGMVAEAYNQAHDETNYLKWKQTEKENCLAAGIQK